MKYWLHVTSYIYWLFMLLFLLAAANFFVLLYVGDVGAHGKPPVPRTAYDILSVLGMGVVMLGLTIASYFSGKQILLAQVVVLFSIIILFLVMGASIWFYSIFIIMMPPNFIILFSIYSKKHNKAVHGNN